LLFPRALPLDHKKGLRARALFLTPHLLGITPPNWGLLEVCFSLIRTKYYNGRFERARKGSQIPHARTSPRAFKNSPQTPEINRELRRAPRAASRALIVDQPLLPTGRTTVDRATTKSDDYITRSTLSTSFTRRNETPGSGSSVTSQSWPLIAQSKAPRIAL